jgi:ferredoxin--NADP+ reductase
MSKILSKRRLSDEVYRFEVEAPLVARERKAGQFVIVQTDEDFGERIPLTIADADPSAGSVTLVFQTVGASTHRLAARNCVPAWYSACWPVVRSMTPTAIVP